MPKESNVVNLPVVHTLGKEAFDALIDPNLRGNFSSEEIDSVWKKLETLVVTETVSLLLKHNPTLRKDLGEESFKSYVAQIAAFFLSGSAGRIVVLPYVTGAAPFSDI